MKLIKFIIVGLLVTLSGEYQLNILVQKQPFGNYIMVFVIYTILLYIFYFIGKFLDKRYPSGKSDLIYYFIAGLIGLSVEWFIIGNSFFSNPEANQAGMFGWWTAVFMIPRIFNKISDLSIREVKKKIYLIMIPYSIISFIIVSLLPADPINARIVVTSLAMTFGFIFVNYYLISYLISINPHLKRFLSYFYRILFLLAIINLF